MTIRWNVKNCDNYEQLHVFKEEDWATGSGRYGDDQPCFADSVSEERRNEHRITYKVVYALHRIGINHISEKNINEIDRRLKRVYGKNSKRVTLVTGKQFDTVSVDTGILQRRIGLKTNCKHQTNKAFNECQDNREAESFESRMHTINRNDAVSYYEHTTLG